MDEGTVAGIALVAIGLGLAVLGVLVFRGNERCFRMLAGGRDFIGLDPNDAVLAKAARQSGVAVCLLAVVFWCVAAQQVEQGLLGGQQAGVAAACSLVMVAAIAAIVVVIALQVHTYATLLRHRKRSGDA